MTEYQCPFRFPLRPSQPDQPDGGSDQVQHAVLEFVCMAAVPREEKLPCRQYMSFGAKSDLAVCAPPRRNAMVGCHQQALTSMAEG